jgi:TonB family protein
MLPQSEFDSPMHASAAAPVAIAAITQDRALIGLLRSVVDPSNDLILVTSEAELVPHLNSRRISVALLDSMFIEGDLAGLAERLRDTWSDLVLIVVGTAEEQSKVASQITSGVVYRFLHRPVSAPRVRLFVEAALRRHEIENDERTLEQLRPDFSRFETPKAEPSRTGGGAPLKIALAGLALAAAAAGGAWYFYSRSEAPRVADAAQVVSEPAADVAEPSATEAAATEPAAESQEAAPLASAAPPAEAVAESTPEPQPAAEDPRSVADTLRQAGSVGETPAPPANAPATPAPAQAVADNVASQHVPRVIEDSIEPAASTPPPAPLTHQQRLDAKLAEAEAALQRGELASPPGRSAVDLFRDALELDPSNTLAKAGLVRVADRLLSAAERALTAGNPEDAKKMVDVAETLTPATARGAFLMMQIEMERERISLTAKRDSEAQDRLERGANYLRRANARLRSGNLIEPAQDNARFYIEAARRIIPDDPGVVEASRSLQTELLTRAGAAATAGNAAETERWLANADGAGASRQDLASIRRLLQETLIGARTGKVATLNESFNAALGTGKLLQPADGSAKYFLFELIKTDAANPAVAAARTGLGRAYLRELRGALSRGDIAAADGWLLEARTISYGGADLNTAESDIAAARARIADEKRVVGANSLARIHYEAPKFPANTRNREVDGWVELEFTVRTDGSTGDIVVTNSNPRKTFDNAAIRAIEKWRYKPVVRNGKLVEQRAAVRIRFTDE